MTPPDERRAAFEETAPRPRKQTSQSAEAVDDGSALQSKAAQDMGLVSDLTDIPEVKKYASRIGARSRSLRKLVVEERKGDYCRTLAEITFNDEGAITAPDDYAPKGDEQAAIRAVWSRYRWPEYEPRLYTALGMPPRDPRVPWTLANPGDVAICRDEKGERILCVEERRDREDGGKDVLIWTHWSDGRWRIAEPPEALPLYGLETIRGASVIYLHEGPKAAKAMQRLIADDSEDGWRSHPWGAELRGFVKGTTVHLGWMGGAKRPNATDVEPLRRSGARIIQVCDNDAPGRDVVRSFSRRVLRPMDAVEFDDRFPHRFDLADPMPEHLFEERKGKRIYIGPPLSDLMQPATWATRQLPQVEQEGRRQRGQSGFAVRDEFAAEWIYIVALGMFVNRRSPGHFYTVDQFNILVRPISDVKDTAALMHPLRSVRVHGVSYNPAEPSGVINIGGQRHINVHVPSTIKPMPGDPRPFLRYLRHLIPDPSDRLHVQRWVATLIARPGTRMEYALMLMSETQGVGKTTLAEHILTPLLGKENVSTPNENEITDSQFTDWIAHKRLISVDEIYAGQSRKTYDASKGRITGTVVRVNKKFQPPYEVENWAHFIVSSNSKVPLFMDSKDRRWCIPGVTEREKPREYWEELHRWLANGGLGIISHWAERFVRSKRGAVKKGEHAPQSTAKAALVEASLSEEVRLIRDVAEELVQRGQGEDRKRILVTLDHFREWLARHPALQGRKRLGGQAVQSVLRGAGLIVWGRDDRTGEDRRVRLDDNAHSGRKLVVVTNFTPKPGETWKGIKDEVHKSMDDLGLGVSL